MAIEINRKQQENKYLNDIRYHSQDDNTDQSTNNRYSLRNFFGLYWNFRRAKEIISISNESQIKFANKKILDIGCHRGYFCNLFANLTGDARYVYGIDLVDDFIQDAKKINNKINFSQHDIYTKFPFQKNFFNIISIIYTFNTIAIKDQRLIAKLINNVLEPQGYIIVFDLYDSLYTKLLKQFYQKENLPRINEKHLLKLFPNYKLIKSKKFINFLTYRLSKFSYILAEICDYILPSDCYIAVLQKTAPNQNNTAKL